MSQLVNAILHVTKVVDRDGWGTLSNLMTEARRLGWEVSVVMDKRSETMQTAKEWKAEHREPRVADPGTDF